MKNDCQRFDFSYFRIKKDSKFSKSSVAMPAMPAMFLILAMPDASFWSIVMIEMIVISVAILTCTFKRDLKWRVLTMEMNREKSLEKSLWPSRQDALTAVIALSTEPKRRYFPNVSISGRGALLTMTPTIASSWKIVNRSIISSQ